jgi:hypothetical protein
LKRRSNPAGDAARPLVEASLDVQVFNDRFDDQIAVFEFREVVVEVSDGDERRRSGEERSRLRFLAASSPARAMRFRTALLSIVNPFFASSWVTSRGEISSSSVGTPAFARCAAICAPIVPAPKTAAFSMRIAQSSLWNLSAGHPTQL